MTALAFSSAWQARLAPDPPSPRDEGDYIIYWLRLAARATENPALEVALEAGRALGKPVFVYHALSQRYRYASDRHHTFILEGARDVEAAMKARGIGYAFHLERPGHDGPYLKRLAERAALVVTEDVPVAPLSQWAAQLKAHAPVWEVDASTVGGFRSVGRAPQRAFAFRDEMKARWVAAPPWLDTEPDGPAWLPALPFEPVTLAGADLPALVAQCEIDHGIGPVAHTTGGAEAGLQRWERFLNGPIDSYASQRSNPLVDGTSRMSAYLHYGHVSAHRLFRDATARATAGAEKFLDELLVWRELAWAFCAHQPKHESLEALPHWARESLHRHQSDERERLLSYEQLARAQTGVPLWDAAQRSLLTHGELHNDVRMSWAKEVLQWSRSPEEALATLIDLNHRYALDGRDPASYSGILWCFGAFDRPFSPEVPVLGAVRPRPIAQIAQRFDVAEYGRRTRQPACGAPLVVAVVGAGVAGLSAARALRDAGHSVEVLDAPGSRLLDAPYFTVTDARFGRYVRAWRDEKLLARWSPRMASAPESPWWVGSPDMSAVLERMAHELDVRSDARVDALRFEGGRWRLEGAQHARGEFDAVVVAVSPPEAAVLLTTVAPELAERCRAIECLPSWVVTAEFDERLDGVDAYHSDVGPVRLAADMSSVPGATAAGLRPRWVFYASANWSRAREQLEPDAAGRALVKAFFEANQRPALEANVLTATWLRSATVAPVPQECAFDEARRLVVCGDGWRRTGAEGAYLSGQAAAGRLLSLARAVAPAGASRPSGKVAQMRLGL